MTLAAEVELDVAPDPARGGAGVAAQVLRRRPALSLVPEPRAVAGRGPFIAFVVALLVSGLLGLLVLNTVLGKDAFALHNLKVQGQALEDREQATRRTVEELRSAQVLEAKARELGMVRGGSPAFLRLSDGVVLGSPSAAVDPASAADGAAGTDAPAAGLTDPDAPASPDAPVDGQ